METSTEKLERIRDEISIERIIDAKLKDCKIGINNCSIWMMIGIFTGIINFFFLALFIFLVILGIFA